MSAIPHPIPTHRAGNVTTRDPDITSDSIDSREIAAGIIPYPPNATRVAAAEIKCGSRGVPSSHILKSSPEHQKCNPCVKYVVSSDVIESDRATSNARAANTIEINPTKTIGSFDRARATRKDGRIRRRDSLANCTPDSKVETDIDVHL
jgi:hypothetical protein